MDEIKRITEANRIAWNKALPYHRKAMDDIWDKTLTDKNYVWQEEPELSRLQDIGIKNKSIIQPCCNNGIELLSLKRLGAGRCVGVDISDEAIKDAQGRSHRFGVDCEFIRLNVYEIPVSFDNSFDMVYITVGALCWIPDLRLFFARIKRLLKPGGVLFIYEQHPLTLMLPWDISEDNEKPVIENNYFYDKYMVYNDSLDYYGNIQYESPDTFEFMHTLSDIMNSITENGFCLTKFEEFEHDLSNGFEWVKKTGLRLPLCYILTAAVA